MLKLNPVYMHSYFTAHCGFGISNGIIYDELYFYHWRSSLFAR
ncbi:protein of unknown function [Legionella micdadei]|uniref:Uncharacterized protein n=1 Tax=Legionella micdadei TaxID=451 RepID=A0A098GGX1_LEGMI|nr:protein of unknown function [Legionella micdadei]